tara:strand:- start:486 stop:773 length:288 start_codon:yes stop_codon:yes gene_type:complete
MPYCRTEFKLVKPEQVKNVLTMFTQECFVDGQEAYQLDDGTFSIDAGENDVRAIYDPDDAVLKFLCRQKREMPFYDKKLQTFAAKHSIKTNITSL